MSHVLSFRIQFLIHADFLLVASREGLEYDVPWNLALRDAVRDAAVKAVKRFIAMPVSEAEHGLRYSWPKFLRYNASSHEFWNDLHKDILQRLRDLQVLESGDPAAGYFYPRNLQYVRSEFRFEKDVLFDCNSLRKKHLSFRYDGVMDELRYLQVQHMDINDLCRELSTWIDEVGTSSLATKSIQWHRQVASLFYDHFQLKETLMRLPLVPLRDGSWVAANSPHLYLTSEEGDEYIPNGIAISIIEREASQDPPRRRFYKFLGIPIYAAQQVCDLIVKLHSGRSSSVISRSPEDMLFDAAYLFKHRALYTHGATPQIYYLVTNQGIVSRQNTRIYFPEEADDISLFQKYKDAPGNPFYILDPRYERHICAGDMAIKQAFRKWLLQSPNICVYPQLIRESQVTPEWLFLRDANVKDLLLVVKRDYRAIHRSRSDLRLPVNNLLVPTRNGIDCRLGTLALPTEELLRECPHLAFVDLPNPSSWNFLEHYGILTVPSTDARLQELVLLANLPIEEIDMDAVTACYRGLSQASGSEYSLIS